MCLSDESTIKIAKKDIVVYKCMHMNTKTFSSPIYNSNKKYKLNILYSDNRTKEYNEYGFYSFLTKYGSINYKNKNLDDDKKIIILKCTIPKGSTYVKGSQLWWDRFKNNKMLIYKGIRSEKIIFNEIIS